MVVCWAAQQARQPCLSEAVCLAPAFSSPLPPCCLRSVQYATGEAEHLDLAEVIRDGHCSLLLA